MSGTEPGALSGLRVIELSTNLAGPYCAQLFGDLGADVIKLESPAGDPTRNFGPRFAPGVSAHFMGVNGSKRAVCIDLSQPRGREVFLALLDTADVLIEGLKTGSLEKWGIGYADFLGDRFPRLVHCSISGFGATGPFAKFPGYDPVAQAMGGVYAMTGDPDGPPMRPAPLISDLSTGLHASFAIMAALRARDASGRGQYIDIGLVDATLPLMHPFFSYWLTGGEAYRPKRHGNRHPAGAPFDIFPTRNGYVVICVAQEHQYRRLCEALGKPGLASDPRFRTNADRLANVDALGEELAALTRAYESEPLAEKLLEANVPAGPILEVPAVIAHRQVQARELILDGPDYKGVATPFKMSASSTARGPAPRRGQHSREVLREAGLDEAEIDALVADGAVRDDEDAAG